MRPVQDRRSSAFRESQLVMWLTNTVEQEDDKPFTVTLPDESFETYELDPPSYQLETTKKDLKQMYYDMSAIRCVLSFFPFPSS